MNFIEVISKARMQMLVNYSLLLTYMTVILMSVLFRGAKEPCV